LVAPEHSEQGSDAGGTAGEGPWSGVRNTSAASTSRSFGIEGIQHRSCRTVNEKRRATERAALRE
jgi:hypothetical protein